MSNPQDGSPPQVPKAAPMELDYSRVTPAAIASSSSESHFVPNNGALFTYETAQIINIPINTSGYLEKHGDILVTNSATMKTKLAKGTSSKSTNKP